MFVDDERPEWDPRYASGARHLVNTPASEMGFGARFAFYMGAMLAQIHSQGHGYSDLHRGNVGVLPPGGLILVDPGGFSTRESTPRACAGDFVVPCLELGPEDFAAFWRGYSREAYKLIDPVTPGFCRDIQKILFDVGDYPGLECEGVAEAVAQMLTGPILQSPSLDRRVVDAAIVAVAISSLNWPYKNDPPNTEGYLRRIDVGGALRFGVECLTLRDVVTSIGSTMMLKAISGIELARPISTPAGPTLENLVGRPVSALIAPFVGPAIDDHEGGEYARLCLLTAVLALGRISKDLSDDAGTALTYGSIAFSIAGSPAARLPELETTNLASWRLWSMCGSQTNLGPATITISHPNVGNELALMHHKAASADRMLFVRSLERAQEMEGYEPAWPAGLSAVDANRKTLLILFYTILALPENVPLPHIIASTLSCALALRISTEILMVDLAVKTGRRAVETVMGLTPDLVIEGAKWAEGAFETLKGAPLTVGDCLQLLSTGLQYFAYVDLKVILPGKTNHHTRQDVWHGFAQALNEDRTNKMDRWLDE